MSSSTNKLLALIFLALVGYASWYWVQNKKLEKEGVSLIRFPIESVQMIQISVGGKHQTSLTRRNDGWQMVEPVKDSVDSSKITEILTFAKGIEKGRVISPFVRNLAPFGLSSPEAILKLETPDVAWELHFGNKTVDEENVFACLGNRKEVFLVSGDVRKNLPDQPFQFREKRLLQLDKNEAEIVEVSFDDTVMRFKKRGSDWIQIHGKPNSELLKSMEKIVDDLNRSFIFSFEELQAASQTQYGLESPRLKVMVSGREARQTIMFGDESQEGFVYAKIVGRPGVMNVEKPLIWKTSIFK